MLLKNLRLTAWLLAVFLVLVLGACSGSESETGEVNTSALSNKITEAENLLSTVEEDADLEDAIDAANSALLDAKYQRAVNQAVRDLNAAIAAFNDAKQGGAAQTINYSTTFSWGTQLDPRTLGLTPGKDTTELMLNWYSLGNPTDKSAYVRFIKGTRTAGTALIEATGTATAASSGNVAHKVTVTGLQPGAQYEYAVSNDGANWSQGYQVSIPAAGAFRFAVVTDPQIDTGNVDSNTRYPVLGTTTAAGWLETMSKIAALNPRPSFIASMGDQVETAAGNEVEYTSFFAPPGLRNLPFAPTVGNHDRAAVMFKSHFNLPNEMDFSTGTGTETDKMGNYYYLYNNILFVVLNSHGTGGQMTNVATARVFIERYEQTLAAAKAAHAGDYDWLIVQHHKSTASVANHVADFDIQYFVEAGFEKLMSDHNVDFVLAGHDHVYARSYPLSGKDNGKVSVPDKNKGTNVETADAVYDSEPGDPIYLTFTTASGQGFYPVITDPYFRYNNALYQKGNSVYPYLGESTNDDGATLYGSSDYLKGNLPVSNARFVQAFIPSYTIVEVDGRTISFKTYPITTLSGTSTGASQAYSFNENMPYDSVTVSK